MSVVVSLRSIRIDVPEAIVNSYYKGNAYSSEKIRLAVKEKVEEMLNESFFGDELIEDIETEEE